MIAGMRLPRALPPASRSLTNFSNTCTVRPRVSAAHRFNALCRGGPSQGIPVSGQSGGYRLPSPVELVIPDRRKRYSEGALVGVAGSAVN